MKKGIDTLIKLRKRVLDELRRSLASLENQKAQLKNVSARLEDELLREIKLAATQPEMGNFFGDFAKRIKNRQQEIANEIKALDKKMDKLPLEISEAYSELKKFEIARENAKKREAAELNRKETIALDEIAGQQHQRKQTEDS
jgi:flagellar export protein FliJ